MTSQDDSYLRALEETQYLDGKGFTKTEGLTGGDLTRSAIQQNNLIIQQLINLSQKVETLVAEIQALKDHTIKGASASGHLDELTKKLGELSLGPDSGRKPQLKGVLYAYKDPYTILEEEKSKLRRKYDQDRGKSVQQSGSTAGKT